MTKVVSKNASKPRSGSKRDIRTFFNTAKSTANILKRGYDWYSSSTRNSKKNSNSRKPKHTHTGRYVGKFKRPRKVKGKNMYISKGFQHTTEVNGQMADPNICYIGHTTVSGFQQLEVICQALIRKLLEKGGHVVTGVKELIDGLSTFSANVWMIQMIQVDKATKTQSSADYQLVASDTIYSICGDAAADIAPLFAVYVANMQNYATGGSVGSANNTLVPMKLVLYRAEVNAGVTTWQHECSLNLENEIVHVKSVSDLKVQNRSLDAAGSTSVDTVSANPLQGKLYRFSSGVPRARVPGITPLEASYDKGYGLFGARGAEFLARSDGFREPPDPRMFWNCKKMSKIRLEPGDIKRDHIQFATTGHLLKVLKRLFIGAGTLADAYRIVNVAGVSSLVALEDVINVSSTANITLAYEVNREYGAYLTTHQQKSAKGTLYQLQYNNMGP